MHKKFIHFLQTLKTESNTPIIEAIQEGFKACHESSTSYEFNSRKSTTGTYTIEFTSDDDDFKTIFELLMQNPAVKESFIQNGGNPETVTYISLVGDIEDAEGQSYQSGYKGSWDEPAYGASFEDGVEITISNNLFITVNDAEDNTVIEGDFEAGDALHTLIETRANDDSDLQDTLQERLIEDFEENNYQEPDDYDYDY